MNHLGRITVVLCVAFVLESAIAQAQVQCGLNITEDVKLTGNLDCTGMEGLKMEGILIRKDVTIDLGGYTIEGDTGAAIYLLAQEGVTIRNGTIKGFESAAYIEGSRDITLTNLNVISGDSLLASLNIQGSIDVRIKDSTFSGVPPGIGIALGGGGRGGAAVVQIHNVRVQGYALGLGILNSSRQVTVTNSNFSSNEIGVRIDDSYQAKVRDSHFTDNRDGVIIGNSTAELTDSYLWDHSVSIGGHGAVGIRRNTIGRQIAGCCVGIFTDDASIYGRDIVQNVVYGFNEGISVANSQNTLIAHNQVFDNAAWGIGLIEFLSIGNRIISNITSGNGIDLFHDGDASPNLWKNNTCVTKSGTDIPACK